MNYIVLSVLLATLSPSMALFFHLKNTMCFIEEIPDETTVIVNYKLEVFAETLKQFVNASDDEFIGVEVKDPSKKIILSRDYRYDGKVSFTSKMPGEHEICLYKGGDHPMIRVHLNMQSGENTIDYDSVERRIKFNGIQLLVRKLLDQVEQITKEQEYQRHREEQFRATSYSTNRIVIWWSIAQLVILIVMGIWQLRHLQSFFRAKKLV